MQKKAKAKLIVLFMALSGFLLMSCSPKEPIPSTTVVSEMSEEETEISVPADENKEVFANSVSESVDEVIEVLEEEDEIMKKISQMSLREKICQMIIVWPEELTGSSNKQIDATGVYEGMKEYPVGGIIYFGNNLLNPEQTKKMIADTKSEALKATDIPLFICVDEEGGVVSRIGNNEAFGVEETAPMAEHETIEEVYISATRIAEYLKELGFNFDFAPDADVITNPQNKIIGNRSFGTDAEDVSAKAKAFSDGLHNSNILSSYKHFPGHGATEGDTHEGYAYTNQTYEELSEELKPFKDAALSKADSIMVAHISLPNVVGDNTPCTLSKKVITGILKGDLGYDGLVITDALNMGAVIQNYTPEEAAVMTVEAGVDIILMPLELDTYVNAIEEAVMDGHISESRIDDSVRKILLAKERMNK